MATRPVHVVRAGREALATAARGADHDVVTLVDDEALASLRGGDVAAAARTLAAVRRADLLVPASSVVADALSTHVPVGPWDMLVSADEPSAAAVRDALARLRARPHRARRLAYVTPLPPDASGVARYSRSLAAALGRRAEVTVVVTDPASADRRPPGTTLTGVSAFEADAACGRFDEIVYALGNHPLHGTQLALARRHAGAVHLHDVRLVGAYAALHAPGDALADELQRLYPGRYERGVLRDPVLTMGPAVDAGVWLAREVASIATTVLVHSRHAVELVADDTGVTAACVGPHAFDRAEPRPVPGPGDAPLVVSVGVVDGSKCPDELVDAIAALAAPAWLAFVGRAPDEWRERIVRRAAALGAADRVVLTGPVSDDELGAWLRRAAVAVQLRSHSNGESSGAVADCLARGLPTIVSAQGASAELPADAVVHVGPQADGAVLAAAIGRLLDDTAERRRLHGAALALAAANGFDAAADRLCAALFGPGR